MLPALVSHIPHKDGLRVKVSPREVRRRRRLLQEVENNQKRHLGEQYKQVPSRFRNTGGGEVLVASPRAIFVGTKRPQQTVVQGSDSRLTNNNEETHKKLQLPRHVVEEHMNFMAVSSKLLGKKKNFVVAPGLDGASHPTSLAHTPRKPSEKKSTGELSLDGTHIEGHEHKN